MTANALDEDVKQTREAEMDAHIGKPIDTNTLYKTMEQLLSLKRFYKQKKILIVDGVEVNREVIKASLHDEYTLLEAENGKEAIEILNHENGSYRCKCFTGLLHLRMVE